MFERFTDRPVEKVAKLPFDWPKQLQFIGHSLAVAYSSTKWERPNSRGRRKIHAYKHLAESENRIFARKGWVPDFDVMGPQIPFAGKAPLPEDFAHLGLFELVDIHLFNAGSSKSPGFDPDDELIVEVEMGGARLGGSLLLWSTVSDLPDEPFLFVYTPRGGVQCIIVGDDLAIHKDGIIG